MDINTIANARQYSKLYDFSVSHPEEFWHIVASELIDWFKPYEHVYTNDIKSFSNVSNNSKFSWFANGKLNATYNCLDRFLHNADTRDKIAYYWQGDNAADCQQVSYKELYQRVCQFSNTLKSLGISKGDRVCIYLPICIEAITAMLACARIGAIHTVVFAGFSPEALSERMIDAECKMLITTDISIRGGKSIPIWAHVQECLNIIPDKLSKLGLNNNHLSSVLLIPDYYSDIEHFNQLIKQNSDHFDYCCCYDYREVSKNQSFDCEPEWLDSEDPLFILYTSGSTGKPKGVLHTTAGYLVHCLYSFKLILDVKQSDVYWCSADIGWVAGHSYVVYGALLNNTTSVIFSGTPNYPDYDIFWKIIDKYKVSIFYTAPTAIRALMKEGDKYLQTTSRESLRVLATVGEPINPEAWSWYKKKVGNDRCKVIDTWWQTETGAAMLSPYVNLDVQKPGCATMPFMGVNLALLDSNHQEIDPNHAGEGNLVIKSPWPGMMRTVYNHHNRFIETYFEPFKGYFYTGDLARRDSDGHYWMLGRSDDVINIAGHRLGTAEIESALASHKAVAESAAIAVPDEVKGQALIAFVVLTDELFKKHKESDDYSNELISDLKRHVRETISPIAIIKSIKIVPGLPKTRSGKIMRRILKQIALESTDFGDISTLTNPEILSELL